MYFTDLLLRFYESNKLHCKYYCFKVQTTDSCGVMPEMEREKGQRNVIKDLRGNVWLPGSCWQFSSIV